MTNRIFESRNDYMNEVKHMPKPLHMVCPNCEGLWGYASVNHTSQCPTPNWVFDARTDTRLGK